MTKRLYFILAEENLFHPKYFLATLKLLDKKKYSVAGVTILKERYRDGILSYLRKQYELWGPMGFLAIGLTSLFYRLMEILKIRDDLSIRSIAKKRKIKFREIEKVNAPDHLNYLNKLKIDVIISSCGQIFKKELLNLPRVACINKHSALLPKYGGVLPVFWAMLSGEKKFGVSVHYMVEKIDQGSILYQKAIPVAKNSSLFSNYILAFNTGVEVTLKALENLDKGIIVKKFTHNSHEYFTYPTSDDIGRFKKKYQAFGPGDILKIAVGVGIKSV